MSELQVIDLGVMKNTPFQNRYWLLFKDKSGLHAFNFWYTYHRYYDENKTTNSQIRKYGCGYLSYREVIKIASSLNLGIVLHI